MKPVRYLKVEGIARSFGSVPVLQSVELTVKKGQILGLIGPNGSGKSTLFNIVTGFECADAGMAYFADARIDGLRPDVIARRGLMRTFQLSEGGLRLTALENLLSRPLIRTSPASSMPCPAASSRARRSTSTAPALFSICLG